MPTVPRRIGLVYILCTSHLSYPLPTTASYWESKASDLESLRFLVNLVKTSLHSIALSRIFVGN